MDIAEVLNHTSPDLFIPDLKATDKQTALAGIVEALIKGTQINNPETILQMLQSRENLGSTAVGPGIAFPHGHVQPVTPPPDLDPDLVTEWLVRFLRDEMLERRGT